MEQLLYFMLLLFFIVLLLFGSLVLILIIKDRKHMYNQKQQPKAFYNTKK